MGLFSPRWHEVLFSANPGQFFRGQNVLRKHGLPFETKAGNRVFQESGNSLGRRTPMLTRVHFGPESGDEYRIFVTGGSTAVAKFLLQNNERTDE